MALPSHAAAALAILTQVFLGTVHMLSPPHTPARHGPIQSTPLPHCRRPTSSVLPISSSTTAHTSPWSLPFLPALSSSLRSAGRKVVAAPGGACEESQSHSGRAVEVGKLFVELCAEKQLML